MFWQHTMWRLTKTDQGDADGFSSGQHRAQVQVMWQSTFDPQNPDTIKAALQIPFKAFFGLSCNDAAHFHSTESVFMIKTHS